MKHLIMKKVVIATQLFLTIGLVSIANAQVADTTTTISILSNPMPESEHTSTNYVIQNNEKVYDYVEQQPQFPGGDSKVLELISQNLRYPSIDLKQGVQGKVIVQFIIDKSGKVRDPKIMRSVSPTLDAEAIRVVNLLPDFIPGRQKGEAVSVKYIIPIAFKIAQ
jgi:TonB family protein